MAEETEPLIAPVESEERPSKSDRKPNPLPWNQLSLALALPFCNSLARQAITPFINQLISELDIIKGDKRKVGYYVGLLDSLAAATLTISVLPLNRLSDQIGRKPVLLVGLFSVMTSVLWVGLSKTFWSLAASQCLQGLLDGNLSVSKNVVGEITDFTNRSRAFSFFLVFSTAGGALGFLIGGDLVKPHESFPSVFRDDFWEKYPYFLPCLVVAIIVAIAFIIVLLFLKETGPRRFFQSQLLQEDEPHKSPSPSLRDLAIYPVIISVANYTSLTFINKCETALLPLFFAMPIEIGGLGFQPAQIGYILSAYSALTTFMLVFLFGPVIRYVGERRFFIFCVSSHLLLWATLPIIQQSARHFGVGVNVWIGIVVMSIPYVCTEMGYSCIYTYIVGAAPNKYSMGSSIAVAYLVASIFRVVAPTMATSLFSFSIQHDVLGGYAVYAFFLVWTALAILLAFRLPIDARPVWEREMELSARS